MASKEGLLSSIQPNMKLTKDFFKRVYGYGVTDESFPDKAIAALEAAGCSKARVYYESWVNEYEAAYQAEIKPVAAWFRRECEKQWEKRRKEGESVEWKKQYSANSAHNNYLQQQREKLMELKEKLQALS